MHLELLMRRGLSTLRYKGGFCHNETLFFRSISIKRLQRNYSDGSAYFHRIGKEPLIYRNLGEQVYRAVEKYGKRLAIVSCHENKRLSFVEVASEAEILAVKLKELGLQRGEHLGIWAPNTTHWYISFLAAALGGFPLVCINPSLQAQDFTYALKKANVKILITMDKCGKQNFYRILKEILPHHKKPDEIIKDTQLPMLERILIQSAGTTDHNEFLNYDELMFAEPAVCSRDIGYLQQNLSEISPETPCNIQFTSGTTGKPKAALLTHLSYVNVSHSFGKYLHFDKIHMHLCLTVPMFHAFGLAILIAALDHGATLVMPSATFNVTSILEAIESEGCNVIVGTPTMFVDMLEKQCEQQKSMHSLSIGLVGGSPCAPDIFHEVKRVFGLKEMRIAYGMSETASAIFAQDGTEPEETAMLSVGRIFEHGEAKVIDDHGKTVKFGQSGELCVRGYFTMSGYFEDNEKTREMLTVDGWLKTGDEFILERNGIGRIVGRKKDIIIRGGENIFPKEIEDYLNIHKDILEAYVVGVPDERMGEELCAFIRLRSNASQLNAQDLRVFIQGRLAHFKIPRYVRIVEEFPKTASGKIQKFKLRDMFQQNEKQRENHQK